jgi:hypothetical protein
MDARLEGFADARLDVDLDYFPSFPFAFNKRTLLRDGFVTVHVEVDLFRSWIAVIPEHYLLGGFHGPHLCQLDADSRSCGALSAGFLCRRFAFVMDRAANLGENIWRHVLHVVRWLEKFVLRVAAYFEITSGGYIGAFQDFCHERPSPAS